MMLYMNEVIEFLMELFVFITISLFINDLILPYIKKENSIVLINFSFLLILFIIILLWIHH